ncbi:FecR family protein [Mucilaginibacter paludis]|uniref:Anti-FecI sigma factor, FecR n=1 Tax=Mucilaginibacter paludis DSM 18603 TaxID=714943 RepID=H1YA56_9SPHI|nr:FecR family protein [Mucilaginibacter paludis]EHQ25937.1 anti-FecI sigma factor, FecR [Mucilaginibacter paludis DSM 18603]
MSLQKPDRNLLELARKWLFGTISEKEKVDFDSWYNEFDDTRHEVKGDFTEEELEARIHRAIFAKAGIQESSHDVSQPVRMWPRIAAAASLLLCLSVGAYFITRQNTVSNNTHSQAAVIMPGSNRAVLTLGNGRQIVLTGAQNGQLAAEGGATINKTADGNVVYNSAQAVQVSEALTYNTMATPRGGQYHLTLEDGTGVWLNAASSIKYPTAFTGNERRVEITGEAYFEVAHNAAKPFRVVFNGQTVEVLGTHFNINAYADEPAAKTTLLEGKVKLTAQGYAAMLLPGQEAALAGGGYNVKEADVEQAIAWKNGLFHFDNTDVKTLMRQVARWYDVEVAYEGKITDYKFAGDLRRNTNLANVLQIFEQGGIHFRIEGRKLIVTS